MIIPGDQSVALMNKNNEEKPFPQFTYSAGVKWNYWESSFSLTKQTLPTNIPGSFAPAATTQIHGLMLEEVPEGRPSFNNRISAWHNFCAPVILPKILSNEGNARKVKIPGEKTVSRVWENDIYSIIRDRLQSNITEAQCLHKTVVMVPYQLFSCISLSGPNRGVFRVQDVQGAVYHHSGPRKSHCLRWNLLIQSSQKKHDISPT